MNRLQTRPIDRSRLAFAMVGNEINSVSASLAGRVSTPLASVTIALFLQRSTANGACRNQLGRRRWGGNCEKWGHDILITVTSGVEAEYQKCEPMSSINRGAKKGFIRKGRRRLTEVRWPGIRPCGMSAMNVWTFVVPLAAIVLGVLAFRLARELGWHWGVCLILAVIPLVATFFLGPCGLAMSGFYVGVMYKRSADQDK